MDELGFSIEGLEDCISKLQALPARVVKGAFGKALASAAVPIVESLEARTPVDTGLLASSIQSSIAVSAEGKGGTLSIGFGKQGHVARLVEMGHRAIGHKPNKTDNGKTVPSHPFMRPALAASADTATEAFQTTLLKSLDEGLA